MGSTTRRGIGLAVALAAVVALGGTADARKHRRAARVDQDLTPGTGAPAGASGRATLALRSDTDGKFEVATQGLADHAGYDVILHGIKIGRITPKRGAKALIRFRSRTHKRGARLGFEPRGLPLEIRNASGTPVLTGTLPELDPETAPCCLPNDDGEPSGACEERSTDECDAAGGTVADARSCLPNPCDGSRAEGTFVCCLPCGDPPPCDVRTEEDCLADQGMLVDAQSCDPNPCAATPPVQTQCCVMDGDDQLFSKCEVRTPDECAGEGGVDMGTGSCDPSPCVTQ